MARVVLITGVSRYPGTRLAAAVAADPNVDRVIGIDAAAPLPDDLALIGRTEFVRADIRNPLVAKLLGQASVDTVVHTAVTAKPRGAGGRTPTKESNVLGTMQLLAAIQKSPGVARLVLKSTTSVYGTSPRDPAVFSEQTNLRAIPRSGYGKDAVEVESYVRGFARRRPDVRISVLRLANVIGPTIDTPLTRYLTLPVVPTSLGFDPRLQFVHETDAVEVMRLATLGERPGVFNVAGDGVLLLSQALRRAGRIALPVPAPALSVVGKLGRRGGLVASSEQAELLSYGRVVDGAGLRTGFGFRLGYSTAEAFDDFVVGRGLRAPIDVGAVGSFVADPLRRIAAPAGGVHG
ncbi:MAG: NAD-dependent epimerase/dehydratase family protein [Actinobacteria bacterium]|nr:NAD-dependent epimerase/dehydratase family protein [Actinomycetota bacterium]